MDNRFTDYYRAGGTQGLTTGKREYINDIQRSLIVNPIQKLVYYKPGKCAGTSIFRHILQPRGGWITQKDNPKEFGQWIDNITDEQIREYFSFIFVRNPFSRLVSFWNDSEHKQTYPEFKDWVKAEGTVFNSDIPTELHCQTQSSLIELPDGSKSNINFIGKVENIDKDWANLCTASNINYEPMVYIKKKNHKFYTDYYDDETKNIVREYYQRDIQVFDYKFGDGHR